MDYYYPTANALNVETGQVTRSYNVINILKVLILPTKILRDFEYDIAFLAANKNFTMGGFFDRDNVIICVLHRDLGSHVPKGEDHVIYLGKKWLVKEVKEYADIQCFVMDIQAVVGGPFTQIFNLTQDTPLTFSQVGTL